MSDADRCLFCRIASGEIESERVLETERVVAFRDLNPQAPTHVLVIPRRHVVSVAEAGEDDAELLGELLLAAGRIAEEEGLEDGWRLVTNVGRDGGQSVFHLHVHLLGGRAMRWPPG